MHFTRLAAGMAAAMGGLVQAAALRARAGANAGEATFYGGNLAGGACSFSTYTLPPGVFGTALSSDNWDNSGNCGACITVAGPGGKTITAMIVDECPGCGSNHLDLFPNAFDVFASPSTGVFQMSWSFVECPITSPLELHNKGGVSQYWFSMQVVNADKAVASLEVSTDGGSTWQATSRQSYNFFEQSSGFGTTTVDVKVTSVQGDVVIVKDVEVASGASTLAASNFGSSPGNGASSPSPSSNNAGVADAAAASASATPGGGMIGHGGGSSSNGGRISQNGGGVVPFSSAAAASSSAAPTNVAIIIGPGSGNPLNSGIIVMGGSTAPSSTFSTVSSSTYLTVSSSTSSTSPSIAMVTDTYSASSITATTVPGIITASYTPIAAITSITTIPTILTFLSVPVPTATTTPTAVAIVTEYAGC